MKLSIGITHLQPGWEIVLKQLGAPLEEIDLSQPITPAEVPVIILSIIEDEGQKANIRKYLNQGGAVLTEANLAGQLMKIPQKKRYIKYLTSDDKAIFSDVSLCDLNRSCKVAQQAQQLPDQNVRNTAEILKFGSGAMVILPSNFSAALLDYRSKRLNFPSLNGERFPSERVAQVSKHGIRQIIENALEYLFRFRKLPYIRLWQFPNGEKNIFGFRVDTDYASPQDVQELYSVCSKNNIRATWFVETKSAQNRIEIYNKFADQEIAYHCYRHRIFSNIKKNRMDFQRGLKILHTANLNPKGYAAPNGEWNPTLAKAVEEHGFLYSSEFGLSYDDLPFYPYLDDRFSSVLQIPVHPISVGRLHWARHTDSQKIIYYLQVIEKKLNGYEPIFLYHHPGQKRFEIFEKIFQIIHSHNIACMTLGEYAQWWKQRNAIRWKAKMEGDKLTLQSDKNDPTVWVRTVYPDGMVYIAPFAANTEVMQHARPLVRNSQLLCVEPRKLRKYTRQMLVHDLTWRYRKLNQ